MCDRSELVGTEQNPKDCENCLNLINKPKIGYCKAFPTDPPGKPHDVFFKGAACPKRNPKNG
jgi:hypothetical protein